MAARAARPVGPSGGRKLTLGFGLVSVPVAMEPLADSAAPIPGKGMCPLHGPTLNMQSVCSRGSAWEHVVPNEEKLTGYPHPNDPKRYVVVDAEVVKSLSEDRTGLAAVESMVDVATIDPGYLDKAYLVWPQPGGERAFDLLATVLREEGKAAAVTAVLSKQTQTILFRWSQQFGCVLGHVVRFEQQIRHADVELVRTAAAQRPAPIPAELAVARQVFATLEAEFEPGEVQDRITPLLQAAIMAAADGTVFEITEASAPVTGAGDLMAALQASLAAVKPKKAAKPKAPRARAAA